MPSHHPVRNRPSSGATKFAFTLANRPMVVAAFSFIPDKEISFPSTSTAFPINSGINDATKSEACGCNGPELSPHRTHTSPTAQIALLHIAVCIGSMDDTASDKIWVSPASIRLGACRAKSPTNAKALIRTPGTKCPATLNNTFGKVLPRHSINGNNDLSNGLWDAISFHNRNNGGMYIPGNDPSPMAGPTYSAMRDNVSKSTNRLRVP
ncbi:hypothetical protein ACHAWU_009654 [Discostella pseudostelligera]|uniref:Uncharacterized protein n=1 Tax=Discostella pseudostelligera TaxID=259834 RepID=A0ABD3MA44_9STRA